MDAILGVLLITSVLLVLVAVTANVVFGSGLRG